jgi:hypothetical protein
VNLSHQLLRKKRHGPKMSRVGEIKNEDSESAVKMIKGFLVVELLSKGSFVDMVIAQGMDCNSSM